ncbi:catalase [Aristophania vespae]|uniref:Catalase n=2 Tax=Aristophania vespae TaxID=2697033 RepID=A0A6P1NDP4_9PROT|nr:catalase [Aristophania vespae]
MAPSSKPPLMRQDSGAPIVDNQNSETAGQDGPVVLEDFALIEKLAHFDRERIPERVVHARGVGAHGYFIANGDFAGLSKAALFKSGKKTPVFVRFSTVMNYRGSPEAARDPRGFATKFYTEEGNWDLVGINLPVFFIRDAIKFPDFVHALKPDPVTNMQDMNNQFDFFSNAPESTHMLTYIYSDKYGMPINYRHMDGQGVHAFRVINDKGETHFVKFHWVSQQGVKGMDLKATHAADTNYATADLYKSIGEGNFPKWDLYVQVLTPKEAAALPYDAFDDTKEWLGVPEKKIGTMVLNKMPDNYFQETEQAAFAPGVMVPGIEPSPDKMLQGRLFSYADTQRYRLGVNYQDLPINRPLVKVQNDHQDGVMSIRPRKGHVNWQPTSRYDDPGAVVDETNPGMGIIRAEAPQNNRNNKSRYAVSGVVLKQAVHPTDNFTQTGEIYRSFSPFEQSEVVHNLASDMKMVKSHETKVRFTSYIYRSDKTYGENLAKALGLKIEEVKQAADHIPQTQVQ